MGAPNYFMIKRTQGTLFAGKFWHFSPCIFLPFSLSFTYPHSSLPSFVPSLPPFLPLFLPSSLPSFLLPFLPPPTPSKLLV